MNKRNKKIIIITAVIAIILTGAGISVAVFLFGSGTAKAVRTTELSTAEKYLANLDYEKAAATLQHVIEVEPNNMEAYLALAKTYDYMGDLDMVHDILKNGIEATDSDIIRHKFYDMEEKNNITEKQIDTTSITYVQIAGKSYRTDAEELVLRECGLKNDDLKKLSEFKNLRRLDISGNNISDISAVSNIKTLTKFFAANNKITDVSALSNLKELVYLGMRGNQIINADSLFELDNLKYLHLSGNKIEKIPSIKENLQLLYLADNKIKNTSAVKKADMLYFDIAGNPGK